MTALYRWSGPILGATSGTLHSALLKLSTSLLLSSALPWIGQSSDGVCAEWTK